MSKGQKTLVGCAIALGIFFLALFPLGIVAAIAIPNLLRARLAANESGAIATLRTLSSAQETFRSAIVIDKDKDGLGEYASLRVLAGLDSTEAMEGPVDPPFIDLQLASEAKYGYRFEVFVGESGCCEESTGTDADEVAFFATAWPVEYGKTGIRTFCIDASGVIRASDIGGSPASCDAVGLSPWPRIGG